VKLLDRARQSWLHAGMKWFGESWGAPCCDPEEQVPVPDGEVCPRCMHSIRPDDQGIEMAYLLEDGDVDTLSWHRRCLMDAIIPRPESPARSDTP
jgi:hypothetical protein